MAARHKDTGAGSSEAPAGQIWDESNIYTAKDSGEGEKPTETGRGGGLPGTAVAPALRLDTRHFAAAEKAWFQKAFQLGGSLILRRSRRPAWPERGSPRGVHWSPGKTEDLLRGTGGPCFSRVTDNAPAIRGRWHRVPRDGAPREQRRVPDIVPQLGTRKQNLTARTHQAKPAKKWTDGVLRKCQRRGPDAPRIRADKEMCRGTWPRPWPAAPAGRENAAKDVATSAARPGARRAAGGTALPL